MARKRSELERTRPDIILTQNNDIFWQRIMADREGLALFLEDYRPMAEGWAMRVLIRKDYGSAPAADDRLTPSPAAASD